jgi:hypothetical protein
MDENSAGTRFQAIKPFKQARLHAATDLWRSWGFVIA